MRGARPRPVPLRRCAGCGEQKPKRDLVRVVRTPGGDVMVDLSGRANGRGTYLCRSLACVEAARRHRGLERALAVTIPASTWATLAVAVDIRPAEPRRKE